MRKWIKRIAVATAALLVLIVAGVVLYVRTAAFQVLLRDQVVAAADAAIRGDVRIGELEGSIWSHLTLRDLRIAHEGQDLVVVPEVRVRYALAALLAGRLDVSAIEVVEPWVRLRQDDEGVWSLAEAVAPTEPAEPAAEEAESGGLPIDVSLPSIEISGGRIEVEPASEPDRTFVLSEIHVDTSAWIAPDETRATLRELGAHLTSEEIPPLDVAAAGEFVSADGRTSVTLDAVDVRTPESAIHLAGSVLDLAALQVDAELRVERLAAAEMRRIARSFSQEWPLAVDLTAALAVRGSRPDLHAELDATAGGAALRAEATADLSAQEPRYRASSNLSEVRPAELLDRADLAGVLHAEVQVSGSGTALDATTAELTIDGAGLRVAEADLGDLSGHLTLERGVGTIDAELVGAGRARVEGEVSIAAERFAIHLDADEVDLGRIGSAAGSSTEPVAHAPAASAKPAGSATSAASAKPAKPGDPGRPGKPSDLGELNLEARLEGTGFSPETMQAALVVDLEPSRIGEVRVDRGKVDVRVAESRARIATLELRAAGATLAIDGEVGLSSAAPVDLDVDVRVPTLGPWLALVGDEGEGSLTAQAEVGGTATALSVEAKLDAREVRTAGLRLDEAHLDADVAQLGATTARGQIEAEVRGLEAGLELPRASLAVTLQPGTPPHALIQLDAEAKDALPQRLRANVAYGESELVVGLDEIALAVPTGVWKLERPAKIVRRAERISVEKLLLSSDDGGSVAVDGAVVSGSAGSDLRIRIEDVALAPFQVFAAKTVEELGGVLEASVDLRGSLEQLEPSGSLTLSDGKVTVAPLGVAIHSIRLDTRFAPDRVDVAAFSARAGEKGRLDLDGSILLRERLPDGIDLHLAIADWPAVDNDRYQAHVAASIDVRGRMSSPEVSGRFEVLRARLRPPLVLPNSSGPPPRDATIVVVQEQREKEAAGGELAEAAKETDLFREARLDLEVVISRGTWVEQDDTSVELAGELTVRKDHGDPDPAVLGGVRVVRGWIYLYGRRFEPEQGVVTFTGGRKIDPSLDIVLGSRVADYQVSTIVSGTASDPSLAFESEPYLEDADILALLMFGQPVGELGEGEKVALEQQAAGLAANYAAGQLGRAMGDAFGFRISELDVTKGTAGVGRYVTDDTYVSIKQKLDGTESSRQIEIEHFLTPRWTLKTQADTKGESGLDAFWQLKY